MAITYKETYATTNSCAQLFWGLEGSEIFHGKRLRIKISGDGTKVSKRLHVTNFTFSIIGEEKCHGAGVEGNYL